MKCFAASLLLLGATAGPVLGQVFSSEFFSDPVTEGWELDQPYCHPITWNSQGWYYQQLNIFPYCPGPDGAEDAYSRSLGPFNGAPRFFLEFRLQTNGDRSGIPYGAPTIVAMGNNAGVLYHITVAQDLISFFRAPSLSVMLVDIAPDVPHTYRVELYRDRYAFYIDASLIEEGVPEGPFPAYLSEIVWAGGAWEFPCRNAWDYIRYGVIPLDGSGDYNSDGSINLSDFYFFQECLSNQRPGINGGPDNNAGPGCRFADFDFDSDVDLLDFAEFQNAF